VKSNRRETRPRSRSISTRVPLRNVERKSHKNFHRSSDQVREQAKRTMHFARIFTRYRWNYRRVGKDRVTAPFRTRAGRVQLDLVPIGTDSHVRDPVDILYTIFRIYVYIYTHAHAYTRARARARAYAAYIFTRREAKREDVTRTTPRISFFHLIPKRTRVIFPT